MAYRTGILFAALATAGVGVISLTTTDAFAKKVSAKHTAQASPPAPVVVPDSNIPADRVPRCFDSVIRYPVPPCY
jgi:hypothetical protein